jgi:hypothetical protein
MAVIGRSVRAILSGSDLTEPVGVLASFRHSDSQHEKLSVYWIHSETEEEVLAGGLCEM